MMTHFYNRVLLACFLLLAAIPVCAARRDPLNMAEIDQLREAAQEPVTRLKLMVKFTRARMAAIEQLRSDPRFADDRGPQIHDLLEDFTSLMDQMDDYIDDYVPHKLDMRKGLKEVVEADSEFQLKLRALKETTASEKESRDYSFVLQSAIDAVNASLDNAREVMTDQEAMAKRKELKSSN